MMRTAGTTIVEVCWAHWARWKKQKVPQKVGFDQLQNLKNIIELYQCSRLFLISIRINNLLYFPNTQQNLLLNKF